MSKPTTLREEWESYLAEVVPGDAEEVQRRETEWAFYAGARAALSLLIRAARKEHAANGFQALSDEIEAFRDRLHRQLEGL